MRQKDAVGVGTFSTKAQIDNLNISSTDDVDNMCKFIYVNMLVNSNVDNLF